MAGDDRRRFGAVTGLVLVVILAGGMVALLTEHATSPATGVSGGPSMPVADRNLTIAFGRATGDVSYSTIQFVVPLDTRVIFTITNYDPSTAQVPNASDAGGNGRHGRVHRSPGKRHDNRDERGSHRRREPHVHDDGRAHHVNGGVPPRPAADWSASSSRWTSMPRGPLRGGASSCAAAKRRWARTVGTITSRSPKSSDGGTSHDPPVRRMRAERRIGQPEPSVTRSRFGEVNWS
jgi:hypothetical protein